MLSVSEVTADTERWQVSGGLLSKAGPPSATPYREPAWVFAGVPTSASLDLARHRNKLIVPRPPRGRGEGVRAANRQRMGNRYTDGRGLNPPLSSRWRVAPAGNSCRPGPGTSPPARPTAPASPGR